MTKPTGWLHNLIGLTLLLSVSSGGSTAGGDTDDRWVGQIDSLPDITSVTLTIPVDRTTLGNWSLSSVFDVNQSLAAIRPQRTERG